MPKQIPYTELEAAVGLIAVGFKALVPTVGLIAEQVEDEAVRKDALETLELLLQVCAHLNQIFPAPGLDELGMEFH